MTGKREQEDSKYKREKNGIPDKPELLLYIWRYPCIQNSEYTIEEYGEKQRDTDMSQRFLKILFEENLLKLPRKRHFQKPRDPTRLHTNP